jgi:hypothetical protein
VCEQWKSVKYAVFGLGNSQWNAFGAFPNYMYNRLKELGAQPLHKLTVCESNRYLFLIFIWLCIQVGDVNTPAWEEQFIAWSKGFWPRLVKTVGAVPARGGDGSRAVVPMTGAAPATGGAVDAANGPSSAAGSGPAAPAAGGILSPTLLTNVLDIETHAMRVVENRELQVGWACICRLMLLTVSLHGVCRLPLRRRLLVTWR